MRHAMQRWIERTFLNLQDVVGCCGDLLRDCVAVEPPAFIEEAQDDEIDGALEAIVLMLARPCSHSQLGKSVVIARRLVKFVVLKLSKGSGSRPKVRRTYSYVFGRRIVTFRVVRLRRCNH